MSEINCWGNEHYFGEVFSGWALVRLVDAFGSFNVGQFEMKSGSWGLTFLNDPSFVFDLDPELEIPEDDYYPDKYWNMLDHYTKRLSGDVEDGYRLIQSCIESGYDFREGGLSCWISHRMRLKLEACKWVPEIIDIHPLNQIKNRLIEEIKSLNTENRAFDVKITRLTPNSKLILWASLWDDEIVSKLPCEFEGVTLVRVVRGLT